MFQKNNINLYPASKIGMSALDKFTGVHLGENDTSEFDWSNNLEEKIVEFDLQCVRMNKNGISTTSDVLDDILNKLVSAPVSKKRNELLTVLYKIIGKTRDIHGGKGEYALAYMMVWKWYKYFPDLAMTALMMFVIVELKEPYGSWKDMKYFCKYVYDCTGDQTHPLIEFCIDGMNQNLRIDDDIYNGSSENKQLSLVSKWIPREESAKFGFLYTGLAVKYFPQYYSSAITDESKIKAVKKCKTQYRAICSKLNRYIDTVQIKQTAHMWAKIDHSKTTSTTMMKQRAAFLNLNLKKREYCCLDQDRVDCAENLKLYMETLKRDGKEVSCSGYYDTIPQMFCEVTPYNMLIKSLNNERYLPLEKIITDYLVPL